MTSITQHPDDQASDATPGVSTHFASPGRADAARIAAQHAALAADPFVTALLDSFPEPAIILNEHRQIVFANDKLATLLGTSKESVLGVRPGESAELAEMARQVADDLIDQIRAQRDLAAAERGDLKAEPQGLDAGELLQELRSAYVKHPAAEGKHIAAPAIVGPTGIVSDPVLLRRVLGNLLKNALEASAAGETVTLAFTNDREPTFRVHNEAVMPESVRLQLFQRSFSTKGGTGRGVGTYSVKLLTETYLHGRVSFDSSPGAGTTFVITLPARDTPDS